MTENFPIVCSVVIGEEADTEASTSANVSAPQIDLSLENLKTTLRKEITEEVKTLLAQSQKELISAIRSSLESRTNFNGEILETPIRSLLSPSKSVPFENVENADNSVAVWTNQVIC